MKQNSQIRHIGIIMDGNRRWAKNQGLPALIGHKKGYEKMKAAGKWCADRGIGILTVYAFSSENWNRSKEEVNYLMNLFRRALKNEIAEIHKNGIKMKVIGQKEKLPEDIQDLIKRAEEKTKANKKLLFNIAISYGGRPEIMDQETGAGAAQGCGHESQGRLIELIGDDEECAGDDRGHARGQTVHAVEEIHGVGDAHEPEDGQDHAHVRSPERVRIEFENHPKVDDDEGGQNLCAEPDFRRDAAEHVVEDAHNQHEAARVKNASHLVRKFVVYEVDAKECEEYGQSAEKGRGHGMDFARIRVVQGFNEERQPAHQRCEHHRAGKSQSEQDQWTMDAFFGL